MLSFASPYTAHLENVPSRPKWWVLLLSVAIFFVFTFLAERCTSWPGLTFGHVFSNISLSRAAQSTLVSSLWPSVAGLLNLGTIILDKISWWWVLSVHCRELSSISGIYPLGATGTQSMFDNQKCPRGKWPQWRVTNPESYFQSNSFETDYILPRKDRFLHVGIPAPN